MPWVIRQSSFAVSQTTTTFVEVKAAYAKDMVTGFIALNGTTVGAVANRTELYGEDGREAEELRSVLSAKGAREGSNLRRILRCI